MNNVLKYILYAVICATVWFAFVKIFGSSTPNSVSAFEWEKQVKVYFGNSKMGSDEDCSKVFPLARTILNAETFGPGALEVLLKGVTPKEKQIGYFTSINDKVLVQKFEIKNRVAYIDFNSRFSEKVAGSCKVTAIKSQIEKTLTSLPDISSVIISVNGQTKGILEP
jgi:spore germination protein GerM